MKARGSFFAGRPAVITVAAMFAFVLIAVGIAAVLPAIAYPPLEPSDLEGLTGKERLDAENARLQVQSNVRGQVVQFVIGLAALSGGVLAWRQFTETRVEAERQRAAKNRDFQLNLYVESLKALGGDDREIRMGGVLSLQRLAAISPADYHTACIEVLSTFVRESLPQVAGPRGQAAGGLQPRARTALFDAPDVQAALSALGELGKGVDGARRLRLDHLDLSSADLTDGSFRKADFTESMFWRARLCGADLAAATLRGAKLIEARLQGACLDGADLRGADFSDATQDGMSAAGACADEATHGLVPAVREQVLAIGSECGATTVDGG